MMTIKVKEMNSQDLFINYHSIMEDINKSYGEIRRSMISLESQFRESVTENNISLRSDSGLYLFNMFVDVYLEKMSELNDCLGNSSLLNNYMWSYKPYHMLRLLVRYAYELSSLLELSTDCYSNSVNYKTISLKKRNKSLAELDVLAKDLIFPDTVYTEEKINENKLSYYLVLFTHLCIYDDAEETFIIPYSNTNRGLHNSVTELLLSMYGYDDIVNKNLSIEEKFDKTIQILRTFYGF